MLKIIRNEFKILTLTGSVRCISSSLKTLVCLIEHSDCHLQYVDRTAERK